jgi:hypothetical protein
MLLSVVLHVSTARSEPAFELRWEALAGCPDRAYVLGQIAAIAGPFNERARRSAHVVISRLHDGSWHAHVDLSDREGTATRELRGETCEALAEATAVVLALTMTRQAQAKPAHVPPAAAPVPAQTSGVSLAGLVDTGTLPLPAVGLALTGAVSIGPFRVEPELVGLFPRSGVVDSRPWEGAKFWLVRLGARACPMFEPHQAVRIGPCLGAGLEWLTASGFGSLTTRETTARTVTIEGGLVALVHVVRPLWIRAGMAGAVPVRRPEFAIEGAGTVHRAAALAFRIEIGPELRF